MVAKRTQHVAPNNVAICCVDMLRSFGRGLKSTSVKNSFRRIKLRIQNENVAKHSPNTIQILNENEDKRSQNTNVEVNIFARQKSKARSKVWIVQNNLHIAGT